MPVLPSSPSDFTATIKSAAVANAAVGGASARPSKNSGGYVSLGALGAIVTQSVVARATISQRFDPDLAPPPVAIVQSLTLSRTGTQEAYVVKYNTNGSIQWARRINGQGDGITYLGVGPKQGIVTDATGNVYVIGTAAGAVTIFDVDNTTTALTLANAGDGHSFIIKYSTIGVPLWARRISGVQGNSIAVDSSGNVYAAGGFTDQGVSVFAANNTTVAFTTAYTGTGLDGYVVKYNSDGTPVWLRRIAGGNTDSAHNIAVDSSGNVFICGYTAGTVNLYNASNTVDITATLTGTNDGYLAKYDTDGTAKWLRKFTRALAYANAVRTDSSGNIYVVGTYNNGGVFTASGGTTSLTLPTSSQDANTFVVKYDTTGEPLWLRGLSGSNTNISFGISVDTSNNVYITGTYAGTLVISNADNSTFLSSSGPGNQWDVGIVKYNSSGTPQWLRRMGGAGDDRGLSVSSDSLGNVYVTGFYTTNTLTVFNGNGTAPAATSFATLANSGTEDAFVVKYDTTGLPLWATRIGGTGSDIGRGIAVDSSGNVYSIGQYTSNPLTLRTTGF